VSVPVFLDAVTHYHPSGVIDNRFFERYLDTSDAWIQSKVGIRERRWMDDYDGNMPVFEIGRRAVQRLVDTKGYDLSRVDLVLSCSSFDDLQYPGPANLISEAFGLHVPAFHVKNGCSTGLFALEVARGLLQLGAYRNILLVNGEPFTRQVDYEDRKACILFGDAASAMIVSSEGGSMELVQLGLGGHGSRMIDSTGGHARPGVSVFQAAERKSAAVAPSGRFQQEGREVLAFVAKAMPGEVRRFLAGVGRSMRDVDFFIGHQANATMLSAMCASLEIPDCKHLRNIHDFGNVSSAGWVTVLSQALEGQRFVSGTEVLVSVFGAGMAWGTALLRGTERLGARAEDAA